MRTSVYFQQKLVTRSIMTAAMAGMLLFGLVAQAQTFPPGLVCDPVPEDPEVLAQCSYYLGLNNIQNVDDGDPNTNMPASRPANCDPLPEDQATLEACIYYMGIENNEIYDHTPQAPGPGQPEGPGLPETPQDLEPADTSALAELVSQVYLWSLGIAGLLAVVASVWGGYLVMTSRGNAAQAQKGKEYIISALTGLVILLGAYVILNTINPDLTDFTIPGEGI